MCDNSVCLNIYYIVSSHICSLDKTGKCNKHGGLSNALVIKLEIDKMS